MAKTALKWVEDHYIPYELPEGASCYEGDLEKEVSCCSCGKKLPYGDCYTSKTIHTNIGMGYAECEDCYFAHLKGESKND